MSIFRGEHLLCFLSASMVVRVGLVGCGTIGSQLLRVLSKDYPDAVHISALHDRLHDHAEALQQDLPSHPPVVSLATLIHRSDLVVEAASAEVAPQVVLSALRANRDVLVMSVGGLLRDHRWRNALRRSRGRVMIPSGALAGLDGVKAFAQGRLRRVTLTTRKPPKAFVDVPYVRRRRLHLDRLRTPTLLFQGSPRQVVEAFPQNTNVAAALLLSLTLARPRAQRRLPVRIRVMADPTLHVNRHELELEADCGRLHCVVESRPSRNPKTSEVAIRSAIASLRRRFDAVSVGT